MAYKVSKLNEHIKKNLSDKYDNLTLFISGEISNFKMPNGSTCFFTLKDEKSSLDARVFTHLLRELDFTPEDGMKVIVEGKVTFWEKTGRISFSVQGIEQQGIGDLHKQFEEMKEKLRLEGLFDPVHKKKLNPYPKTIGVVTSKTGAVIGDIMRTIHRRYPLVDIELFPAVVQGKNAAASIVKGIQYFEKKGNADLLIVGRGGGSLEELWAFNEEEVARAIFVCQIPIISAVGHDADVSIADFVADVRASTPTAAAELATPFTMEDLGKRVQSLGATLFERFNVRLEARNNRLQQNVKNVALLHPRNKLARMEETTQQLKEKITHSLNTKIERKTNQFEKAKSHVSADDQLRKITELGNKTENQKTQLKNILGKRYEQKETVFSKHLIKLDNLSPLKTMARGYSLSYKEGKIIRKISDVKPKDLVTVQVQKGRFTAEVKDTFDEKGEMPDGP